MQHLLQQLDIFPENLGGCTGKHQWYSGTKNLPSINPATEEAIGYIKLADEEVYEKVITTAQKAFINWRQIPAPKRGDIIRQIAKELRFKKDALGTLVSLEMGKSKVEGDGEVQEMIDIADFAVGQARMLYGKTMHSERAQHRMYEQWHPYGVTGVITAFNFPMAVWSWNAFIAAICGNTVIWKPSSKTPLCAIAIQHICNEVMDKNNLSGIFSLFIPDGNDLAQKLAEDKRVPLISFTGSTAVGRKIGTIVAKRLGRSILELGGNNAIIVDETADLDLVVRAIIFGAIGTTGQRCTTTRRIIIQKSIYPVLKERLLKAYQQIAIGDPLDKDNHMGPLIDAEAVKSYLETIAKLKKLKAEVLYGGNQLQHKGYFVEPCLIYVTEQMELVKQETFAPILYLMTYGHLEEAIQLHNAVDQGLSSAIFTNNLRHAEYFLSALGSDCGIANVNIGTSGAEIGGAFGGEKDTGGGREAGSDAWKSYMRRQTNTINWSQAMPLAQGIKFL